MHSVGMREIPLVSWNFLCSSPKGINLTLAFLSQYGELSLSSCQGVFHDLICHPTWACLWALVQCPLAWGQRQAPWAFGQAPWALGRPPLAGQQPPLLQLHPCLAWVAVAASLVL